MTTEQVEQLKAQGNAAFSAGRFQESVEYFSQALALDAQSHILWSNRSAALASLRKYDEALEDAERAVSLKPDWAKGYGRKAAALVGLGLYVEAQEAYRKGLEMEPENVLLKRGLESLERDAGGRESVGKPDRAIDNPFADPLLWEKLQSDPKMRAHLGDPEFVKIINQLQQDPKSLAQHIRDPRVMQAFAAMLGVDLQSMNPAASSSSSNSNANTNDNIDTNAQKSPAAEVSPPQSLEKTESTKQKELGNEAYKRKDFEAALQHYENAMSLDPENVSIITNKSAVFFETGQYEECISLCHEAVQKGREAYADFKLIAKALGRIGSCFEKKGNLEQAISYYQKSLTEHRTPDVLSKLKEAEKTLEAQRKAAYHDPALAEASRNAGNDLFKEGNFVEALKHYTEAIKRDEKDPRGWSNRAACYLKLAAVPEGLKDCEKAIELDPSFIKAYLRKASLLHFKKDYSEALEVLSRASDLDKDSKHASEIQAQITRCYQEIRKSSASSSKDGGETEEEVIKRAMQNPETREILNDPVMMQILRQMQSDPRAAMEHLQNPAIASKIRKLAAAGIVKLG